MDHVTFPEDISWPLTNDKYFSPDLDHIICPSCSADFTRRQDFSLHECPALYNAEKFAHQMDGYDSRS